MPSSVTTASRALLLGLFTHRAFTQTCNVFGTDFQDQGSYFQNSQSTAPFTFVQYFEGCQNDTANNLLVDQVGNEWQCTDTPLTPDDTPELSTCPIDKNQLYSGEWSILIISNNGNGAPIAYERDFTLTVGVQQTTTYTPTVVVPVVSTPVVNATSVETDIATTTLPQSTVTEPSTTVSPTRTMTPSRVTITTTQTLLTITKTIPTFSIAKTTSVLTASCSIPPKQHQPDPWCRITPTLIHAAALETPKSAKFRVRDGNVLKDKAKFLEERHARLARVAKRAPDQPTSTVTDTNTADYITSTSTSTAPTSTLTVTSTSETTSTLTPKPVVILSGTTTAKVVTVTAPTPTRTITKFAVKTVWTTKNFATTITIKSTSTPAAASSACKSKGGIMV